MKNFTYRSFEEKENIEAIIKQRRRKVNRQQIISGCILAIVLGSIGLYIAHHIFYTELDGYVHVDANKVRTPFDIYLDSVYVKTGDIVVPGDTLYSYYMLDMLVQQANPNEEPGILVHNRNYSLQYENIAAEISVLKVTISELQKQIALEDHNIAFGLSQNSHKLDLQRALSEALARLRALRHELAVLGRMKRDTDTYFPSGRLKADGGVREQLYDNRNATDMRRAVSYRLASDSSIITEVFAPDHMIFFEKEEIMTKQHLNLEANNLQIVAYVPIDKMRYVTNNSRAIIIVNDDYEYSASVSILGMRTDLIPENLRSYFSKKNTAIIALLHIDTGETIPFWTVASGLPVTIRIRNYHKWEHSPTKPDYLWFTTGVGVSTIVNDSVTDDTHFVPLSEFLHRTDSLINDTLTTRRDSAAVTPDLRPLEGQPERVSTRTENAKRRAEAKKAEARKTEAKRTQEAKKAEEAKKANAN